MKLTSTRVDKGIVQIGQVQWQAVGDQSTELKIITVKKKKVKSPMQHKIGTDELSTGFCDWTGTG